MTTTAQMTMHNQTQQPVNEERQEWRVIEHELAQWENRMGDLKDNADRIGDEIVEDLEKRFRQIQLEFKSLRENSEFMAGTARSDLADKARSIGEEAASRTDQMRDAIVNQTKKASEPISVEAENVQRSARDTTRAVSEKLSATASDIQQGSDDVAASFRRAWDELKQGFESAASRFEKTGDDQT